MEPQNDLHIPFTVQTIHPNLRIENALYKFFRSLLFEAIRIGSEGFLYFLTQNN